MTKKYDSGFLEQCEANGLPFLASASGGNPPIVSAKLSGNFKGSQAVLRHVTVSTEEGYGPKLTCSVEVDGVPVITKSEFADAVNMYECRISDGSSRGTMAETWSNPTSSAIWPPYLNPGGTIAYSDSGALLQTRANSPNSRAELRASSNHKGGLVAPVDMDDGGYAIFGHFEASVYFKGKVVQQGPLTPGATINRPQVATMAVAGFYRGHDAYNSVEPGVFYGLESACCFMCVNDSTWRCFVGRRNPADISVSGQDEFARTHDFVTNYSTTEEHELYVWVSKSGNIAKFYVDGELVYTAVGGLPTGVHDFKGVWSGCAVRDISQSPAIQSGNSGTPTGGSATPLHLLCKKVVVRTGRLNNVTIAPTQPSTITPGFVTAAVSPDDIYFSESFQGGYIHGLFANNKKGIYFSYVLKAWEGFTSYLTSTYPLAPFALEPEAGVIDLYVENQELPALPVYCTEGYNYDLQYTSDTPSITFSVTPGAGEGVQPCQTESTFSQYIRRIDGQEANDRGEFTLQTPPAECITVDSRYVAGSGRIRIDSHCAPCCRCRDYKDASDYAKWYAVAYNKAVKKLNELIATYNSVARAFASRVQCCTTAGTFTPRFRLWPQQNFKLQIQAMAENNTDHRIRVNSLTLTSSVTVKYDITATDENGITYSMSAGQSIACIPISDASYLYFKNLNPTSQGINFRIAQQGTIETTVDLTSLPLPSCHATGDHPNDVEPCTGYTMITAGLVIVDPVFRKIVNLLGSDVQVEADLSLRYMGSSSAPGQSPCGPVGEQPVAANVKKPVRVSPNKKSVNPCPSAKASYISVGSSGSLYLKFTDSVYGTGNVFVVYKGLIDNQWVELSSSNVTISANGQSEVSIGQVPTDLAGALQVSASYTAVTNGLSTRCKAVDASDDEVSIPASTFEVAASFFI